MSDHKVFLSIPGFFLLLFSWALLVPDLARATPSYKIGVGDTLSILVWNEPQLTRDLSVLPDGSVSVPLVGRILAAGYTTEELEHKISGRMKAVFKKRPTVAVTVRSIGNNIFYIMGAVGHPGTVSFTHNIRILQAIILAGGASSYAKTKAIILIRHNKARVISIEDLEKGKNLKANIPIEPEDTIIVPAKTDQIFILGEVAAPGPYFYEDGMTVMKALIGARGFTQFASAGSVKIVRENLDGTKKIIPIDVNRVESEKRVHAKEFLKPGDTIFVPQRLF
ncbi:MAG: polysaccharide biosynthesis/export family protein [Leptospirales bacterium]